MRQFLDHIEKNQFDKFVIEIIAKKSQWQNTYFSHGEDILLLLEQLKNFVNDFVFLGFHKIWPPVSKLVFRL